MKCPTSHISLHPIVGLGPTLDLIALLFVWGKLVYMNLARDKRGNITRLSCSHE